MSKQDNWQKSPTKEELRQMRAAFGRTSLQSLHHSLIDVQRISAAKLYRENWDGCRALWVQDYRLRKAWRLHRSEQP